jgi:palmitoyltransferase
VATERLEDWLGEDVEDRGLGGSEEDEEFVDEGRKEGEERGRRGSVSGEEGWRNSEGERLKDFGLDEEVEFYDEQQEDDDVPLSQLLERRRAV